MHISSPLSVWAEHTGCGVGSKNRNNDWFVGCFYYYYYFTLFFVGFNPVEDGRHGEWKEVLRFRFWHSLRNTAQSSSAENPFYPKNEGQALTSNHIQWAKGAEVTPLIFCVLLKQKREGEEERENKRMKSGVTDHSAALCIMWKKHWSSATPRWLLKNLDAFFPQISVSLPIIVQPVRPANSLLCMCPALFL